MSVQSEDSDEVEWKTSIVEEIEDKNAEKLEELEDTPVLATTYES